MADQIMSALARALAPYLGTQYKDVAPSTDVAPYLHGPGGLFGVSGLERNVISARVQPRGIASMLPVKLSNVMNPLFPYITGFQAVTGTNPTGVCDDGQVAGPLKNCLQTAQFGRYTFMTRALERNRLGQQIDRGEFFDLNIVNDPLLQEMNAITPSSVGNVDLNREILTRFSEVGVAFQNKLIPQVYVGNPANGNGAGYKEFPGLDILIGTGKVDALTGTTCPALDSDIKNFNFGLVGTADIVNYLTYIFRYLRHNADRMGFSNPTWKVTMRTDAFYEITAVWPCSYLTYRCQFRTTDGTTHVNVDAGDQIAMRDSMRQGKYLLIDGDQVEVILDDGITEETNADNAAITPGQYASDIYIIPWTASGLQLTYWEFFNFNQGPAEQVGPARADFWTDDGRFMWHHKPPNNWCEQWMAKTEPRVILQAPQLAGRLQNVRYEPLQKTREPFNSDPYFKDGGQATARQGPSLFSDWNLGT